MQYRAEAYVFILHLRQTTNMWKTTLLVACCALLAVHAAPPPFVGGYLLMGVKQNGTVRWESERGK